MSNWLRKIFSLLLFVLLVCVYGELTLHTYAFFTGIETVGRATRFKTGEFTRSMIPSSLSRASGYTPYRPESKGLAEYLILEFEDTNKDVHTLNDTTPRRIGYFADFGQTEKFRILYPKENPALAKVLATGPLGRSFAYWWLCILFTVGVISYVVFSRWVAIRSST